MNKSNNLSRVLEISTANEIINLIMTTSQQYQNFFSKCNTNIKTKDIKTSIRKEYSYIFPIRTTFFHVPIDQFFKKPVSPSCLKITRAFDDCSFEENNLFFFSSYLETRVSRYKQSLLISEEKN